MNTSIRFALCALLLSTSACLGAGGETPEPPRAQVSAAARAVAPPLHLLPPAPEAPPRWRGSPLRLPRASTSARQSPLTSLTIAPALVPRPLLVSASTSFEGVGESFVGPAGRFTVASAPPDPVGDVGPGHYVQMVNSSFAVFDKVGRVLFGPNATNGLFSAFSGQPGGPGLCASTNQGDGIVLYDPLADRWFLSQFAFTPDANGDPIPPSYQCVAVSQTADPTGGYNLYAFGPYDDATGTPAVGDYAKFGVWPDAYYATYNVFTRSGTTETFVGSKICALDRASMLAGSAATQQCFQLGPTHGGLLPADLDGRRPPPVGLPGLMLNYEGSTLQLWRLHVDWATPANSTLSPPASLLVETITELCPATDTCVPQAGTSTQLDTVGDRLMHRLAYRNFGDHEALVATHTVDAGGVAGIRWYELRNVPGQTLAAGVPVLQQMGTHAPDATWRWMGSIAQDQMGDVAVGFSASSAAEKPSARYAGRSWNDAPNALGQGEATLVAGTGVQTTDPRNPQTALSRWGDYTALTVDPADDCTFWYTNQYLATDGGSWLTRIGSFRLPACPPRFTVALPACATSGSSVTATITATDGAGATLATYAGPVNLSTSDPALVLPTNVRFVGGVATVRLTFRTAGTQAFTVADPVYANFIGTGTSTVGARGTGAAASYQISLAPSVASGASAAFTVTALDASCNVAGSYAGTTRLTTSDPAATLPATAQFVAGVASGLAGTFRTPGTQSITALDAATAAIRGTASTAVAAPPSARVTAPADGATVRGAVSVAADASVGAVATLASLDLLVDGAVVASAAASPVQASWDTTQVADGPHVLTARAADGLGGAADSAPVSVTVENAPLAPGSVGALSAAPTHGGCGQPATPELALIALPLLARAAVRGRRYGEASRPTARHGAAKTPRPDR